MVIVETIALSTMVCNDLVMPVLLRMKSLRLERAAGPLGAAPLDPPRSRSARSCSSPTSTSALAGEAYALVAIGLISFAAVAQFAPAILGGIYWRGGTRARRVRGPHRRFRGMGLHAPAALLRQVGLAAARLPHRRPLRHRAAEAAAALRPHRPRRDHARPVLEHARQRRRSTWACRWRAGRAPRRPARQRCSSTSSSARTRRALAALARQRLGAGSARRSSGASSGRSGAREAFLAYAPRRRGSTSLDELPADADLVHFAETQLAGAIGGASARVIIASVVQEEPLGARRGDGHPRRGVAGRRLQPRARAEVARAREPRPPSSARRTRGSRSSTA